MKVHEAITCPYCGHTHSLIVDSEAYDRTRIVNCDCEEGGCDADYVVRLSVSLLVEASTHAIEGFAPSAAPSLEGGHADAVGTTF